MIENKKSVQFRYTALISVYFQENPRFLEKSLLSIVNQELAPTEVILIEDGIFSKELKNSIDSFEKQCQIKDIQVIIIEHPEPQGLARSLNEGIKMSSTDFIARFDSDDISSTNRVLVQAPLFSDGLVSVVGSYVQEFSDTSDDIRIKKVPLNNQDIVQYAKKRNPMNHMSVIFRKDDVAKVGSYDEISFFEDYQLWVKLLLNHKKFINLSNVLVSARTEDNFLDRRSGLKYAKAEFQLQKIFYKLKFINLFEFLRNFILRSIVRVAPKAVLKQVYVILRG
ncbi:glycosyltransferase [Latilactobacillus sakei]|uniref:glycosyltransferase n=1 Tax=Latilactobacillus sakei TaxID=1599 RepID=UPI001F4C3B96|nr:glycosyltransferase [Latilactobacillus sakei]UNC19050.1 glycosyltransferase [Latilactobacillus sakei]